VKYPLQILLLILIPCLTWGQSDTLLLKKQQNIMQASDRSTNNNKLMKDLLEKLQAFRGYRDAEDESIVFLDSCESRYSHL